MTRPSGFVNWHLPGRQTSCILTLGSSGAGDSTVLGVRECLHFRDRKQEKIYNCKLSEVTAQRRGSGAYLPITRFGLEQTVNSPGSTDLAHASILRGRGLS